MRIKRLEKIFPLRSLKYTIFKRMNHINKNIRQNKNKK